MAELKFEILEEFGTLSTSKSGWNLELNFVQWGDNQPKFDLRTWSPDHKKMGKGITLTHTELVKLQTVIEQVLQPEAKQQIKSDATDPLSEPILSTEAMVDEENIVDDDHAKPAWGKLNDF